ncbi:MAG TPA: hypothetical protein VFD05_00725 [Bacilli bacterium]|nr:hypothetical protein [Bacilli bacterium]
MGILDKIKAKIGSAIEKSAVSQMTDEEKTAYKAEREALKPEVGGVELSLQYTKEEVKDLESLLLKLGAIDNRKVWIGGFLKQRQNTNAKFANMFSGHKNLRFLTLKDDIFFMIKFEGDKIYSYKAFKKEHVASVRKSPVFTVALFEKVTMHLEVTKNKQKVNELVSLLK